MIKVTMLGTSGSTPTKHRGLASAAITYNGNVYLFDCGEGTQMKMMQFGVNVSKVKAIFLTHLHGDHTIGIAGLIRTLGLNARREELTIFIPKGYEKAIKSLIVFDKALINYPIQIKGINGGIIYEGDGFKIKAFKLEHSIADYGFAFLEDDKVNFIKEKTDKLGIKGLMFKELEAKGYLQIKRKKIKLKDVTKVTSGKKIIYASDTRPTRTTITAAKEADLLIHEAAFAAKDFALAKQRKHSTSAEAAGIAKKAKAKMLLLTHISARYRDTAEFEADAKAIFKNTVVAKDGYKILL